MGLSESASAVRRPWFIAAVALISAVATAVLTAPLSRAVAPSVCTSIKNIPFTRDIEYGAAIQGIFNNFDGTNGCIDCHFEIDFGPSGDLDLTAGVSWGNIVNATSAEDSSYTYVVPFHPEQSLLFQKINCDPPPVGQMMPRAGTLSAEQQALVWDWILSGAPVNTTDDIFIGNFELRGFVD